MMDNSNHKDQIEIVLQYLKIETNYAVIINGDYGIGKTYFYKNKLIPEIETISILSNDKKYYKPVHISLFGLKTLEEIQSTIFVELFPWLKNKNTKLAASIGKTLLRGIAQLKNLGNIDDYIGDLKQDKNDWLKFDELVICFDDIDRRSDSLDLRDVFGFINSLVENQGVKIIIIANHEELIKDENYTINLREKIIGISLQYNPNSEIIFDNIINERYSSPFKVYTEFLKNNKKEILKVIKINKNNFRNLIFFLEHFRTIFNSLEEIFLYDKNFAVIKEEKQKAVLYFTITTAIEYKLGLLNSTNYEELKQLNIIPIANINFDIIQNALNENVSNITDTKKQNYLINFTDKYSQFEKIKYFDSIINYLLGIKTFNVTDLKIEIENLFVVENEAIPEYELILKKLEYTDCLKLSYKEYRNITTKVLKFVDKGVYQLNKYTLLMLYSTRFNNLLNYDIDELKKRFNKGILKGYKNYKYNRDIDIQTSIYKESDFYNDLYEIRRFCLDINDKLLLNEKENDIENLFQKFSFDIISFFDIVNDYNSIYLTNPFWNDFNVRKVYNRIIKLEGDQIWHLGYYFQNRYRKDIQPYLFKEKEFLIELNAMLQKKSKKRQVRNIHNACLDFLSKCLTDGISNFPVANINNQN